VDYVIIMKFFMDNRICMVYEIGMDV